MNDVLLTLDVDWAPDFAIDLAAEKLISNRVRATWIVTHESPAIDRLRRYPELFELGIHPNFLAGSSHGSTAREVLGHCLNLVPTAISARAHCLFQSTPLLCEMLDRTPIRIDGSLYLPHARSLAPVAYEWNGRTLLRIPHFWEDDFEMERTAPIWELAPMLAGGEGLRVFDFHPIHVFLNSRTPGAYQDLKASTPSLSSVNQAAAENYVQTGSGAGSVFAEVVQYLATAGESLRMSDLRERWLSSRGDAAVEQP